MKTLILCALLFLFAAALVAPDTTDSASEQASIREIAYANH